LDQIGPFGRTVEDAAILLGAIAGHDPKTQLVSKLTFQTTISKTRPQINQNRCIKETFGEGLDEVVEQAVNQAIEQLKNLGAEVQNFLPPLPPACPHITLSLPQKHRKLGSLRRR